MARVVIPLAVKAVRYAGRTGLKTGMNILGDVLSGENVKTAAKSRASAAFEQAKQDALAVVKRRRAPATTARKGRRRRSPKVGQNDKTKRVMTMVR